MKTEPEREEAGEDTEGEGEVREEGAPPEHSGCREKGGLRAV